jgi:hypothetical protein
VLLIGIALYLNHRDSEAQRKAIQATKPVFPICLEFSGSLCLWFKCIYFHFTHDACVINRSIDANDTAEEQQLNNASERRPSARDTLDIVVQSREDNVMKAIVESPTPLVAML